MALEKILRFLIPSSDVKESMVKIAFGALMGKLGKKMNLK